jgi:hypothetical protein
MLESSSETQEKFRFEVQDHKLIAFVGEAFIIKARKFKF